MLLTPEFWSALCSSPTTTTGRTIITSSRRCRSGRLAWTAAKMIVSEPFFASYLAPRPIFVTSIYIAVIGGVLGIAWLRKRVTTIEQARKEAA